MILLQSLDILYLHESLHHNETIHCITMMRIGLYNKTILLYSTFTSVPGGFFIDMSIVLDPYARLSFLTQSSVTEKKEKSLCPTWDQTLIFEELEIYGDPRAIEENPPEVMIELFDYDKFVSTHTSLNFVS